MFYSININDISDSVVKETKLNSFIFNLLSKTVSFFNRKMHKHIDNLIFKLDGSYIHLHELTIEETKKLYADTQKAISEFDKLDDKLSKVKYMQDPNLAKKFDYLLKLLSKYENKLHHLIFASAPFIKTDPEIIQGIANTNRRTLSKILNVSSHGL